MQVTKVNHVAPHSTAHLLSGVMHPARAVLRHQMLQVSPALYTSTYCTPRLPAALLTPTHCCCHHAHPAICCTTPSPPSPKNFQKHLKKAASSGMQSILLLRHTTLSKACRSLLCRTDITRPKQHALTPAALAPHTRTLLAPQRAASTSACCQHLRRSGAAVATWVMAGWRRQPRWARGRPLPAAPSR